MKLENEKRPITPVNVVKHIWGTILHKWWVFYYILRFCMRMMWRSIIHDWTKFTWRESEGFFRTISELKHTSYGTDEYRALLREIKPNIQAHYEHWSHHPEYYPEGLRGMDLEDFVEMWCDWNAAVRRHADGSISRSIDHNKDRFEMDHGLCQLLRNSDLRHN